MKKYLLMISISIISIVIVILKIDPINAYGVNDTVLNVAVKYISADAAAGYNQMPTGRLNRHGQTIQEGDYAVSLTILNNSGFAGTGYRIYYNSSLSSPITYVDVNNSNVVKPIYYKGDVLANSDLTVATSFNTSEHLIGFGTMGTVNATGDGIIYTIFLRPTHELSLTEQKNLVTDHCSVDWYDAQTNAVPHIVYNGFTLFRYVPESTNPNWVIGDIDYDGTITITDAQLIQGISMYVGEYVDSLTLSNNDDVTKLYIVSVADVNKDGIVNVLDALAVLDYYSTYIAGSGNLNNYTGIIGNTIGAYVEYSVTFS